MKVLVTGADGFVGRYLVRALAAAGHHPVSGVRPGGQPAETGETVPLELGENKSLAAAMTVRPDAVVHLAAVASGREARRDPVSAWSVNATGTARLVAAVLDAREAGGADPIFLYVSSGEVYGAGRGEPRLESDPVRPQSPYAASKAAAELAALEAHWRLGLRTVVARPFPHTGPGQTDVYALPAFVARLRDARARGGTDVTTGDLAPVRDVLDVRDVARAYLALLERGEAGETYNVARGEGRSLQAMFDRLAELLGVPAAPRTDPALLRSADIAHLVGDSTKLRGTTGWSPAISLDDTLRGLVDAETD